MYLAPVKNRIRKMARKLARGDVRIDRICSTWHLSLFSPGGNVKAKGRTLSSAAGRLFIFYRLLAFIDAEWLKIIGPGAGRNGRL